MRLLLVLFALAGCDRVFGLGDPYEDARPASDGDLPPIADTRPPDDSAELPQVLAHFAFDEDLNDDTETYVGSDIGFGVTLAQGHRGLALTLDGRSCLEIPLAKSPPAFTIAFWARPAELTDSALISRAISGVSQNHAWLLYETAATGSFGFEIYNESQIGNAVANSFVAGEWHHYAVTYDGQAMLWWRDGTQVFAYAAPSGIDYGSVTDEYIGCLDGITSNYAGQIDELYFFDGALPMTDIEGLALM
jgi:hypothetical protein